MYKNITVVLLLTFLLGCKEKKMADINYEFSGNKLCALKTSDMKAASEFGRLDSSFKYKENIFDEKYRLIYVKKI